MTVNNFTIYFPFFCSIKTELSEIREQANLSGGRYKQNQKFEEMRRLADTLVQEKKEWNHKKQYLEKEDQVRKEKMEKDQVYRYICLGCILTCCLRKLQKIPLSEMLSH